MSAQSCCGCVDGDADAVNVITWLVGLLCRRGHHDWMRYQWGRGCMNCTARDVERVRDMRGEWVERGSNG
jgi:hypothetical protein